MAKPAPNARDAAIWLPVADLRPNPRNPRLHGSEVAQLARTILRTAWGAPIVAQARGRRDMVLPVLRAGIAAGALGAIVEVHPSPDTALSDGTQSLPFTDLQSVAAAVF